MKGVSVCITAYKTKDFIKECLDSVYRQTWFKNNDNWEVVLGIDGCRKTLRYVKTIMPLYKNLRVLMMKSNKGTYITSNTIISQARYEDIFRFDSDDIMADNLIETVLKKKGNCCLVRYCCQNFGGRTDTCKAHGTIYIQRSVFMKYGGFRSWLCGADSELYKRLSKFMYVRQLNDVLMWRRVHDGSLTQKRSTGRNSRLRKKYSEMIKEMKIVTEKDAINEMETNTFKVIVND